MTPSPRRPEPVSVTAQVRRLTDLGAHDLAEVSVSEFASYADGLPDEPDALVVVHPTLVPAARLATATALNTRRSAAACTAG